MLTGCRGSVSLRRRGGQRAACLRHAAAPPLVVGAAPFRYSALLVAHAKSEA
jgi:hypothetical protein